MISDNELWTINMELEKNWTHELSNEIPEPKVHKISQNSIFWQVINAILLVDWLMMYKHANTYSYTINVNCICVCGWWIGGVIGGG